MYTSILNYSQLKDQDITTLQAGSYIWTALEKDQINWAVYKYMATDLKVQSVTGTQNDVFQLT